MPSFEEKVGEPQATTKDYVEIIRSESAVKREYLDDTGLPAKIVYYCLECKKLVAPKRVGQKFRFACPDCKAEVAFGTETAIGSFYRIPGYKKAQTNTKE